MPERAGRGKLPRLRPPNDAQMENPSYPAWQPEWPGGGSTETGDTRFRLSRRVVALRRSANNFNRPLTDSARPLYLIICSPQCTQNLSISVRLLACDSSVHCLIGIFLLTIVQAETER